MGMTLAPKPEIRDRIFLGFCRCVFLWFGVSKVLSSFMRSFRPLGPVGFGFIGLGFSFLFFGLGSGV